MKDGNEDDAQCAKMATHTLISPPRQQPQRHVQGQWIAHTVTTPAAGTTPQMLGRGQDKGKSRTVSEDSLTNKL
jgi:hypothetical protein